MCIILQCLGNLTLCYAWSSFWYTLFRTCRTSQTLLELRTPLQWGQTNVSVDSFIWAVVVMMIKKPCKWQWCFPSSVFEASWLNSNLTYLNCPTAKHAHNIQSLYLESRITINMPTLLLCTSFTLLFTSYPLLKQRPGLTVPMPSARPLLCAFTQEGIHPRPLVSLYNL